MDKPTSAGKKSFNPRPCVRGDRKHTAAASVQACFNPRPCVRGDLADRPQSHRPEAFQSTPLCEGRLRSSYNAFRRAIVSIHAPV